MIEGVVNAAYEPVIVLTLQGPSGRTRDIEAVVDTGFNGFLALPPALVADLGLPFISIGQATLADGSDVAFNVHGAALLWDGRPRHVEVGSAGATPLVGMLLLDGHDLNIQVRDGGRVLIQAGE